MNRQDAKNARKQTKNETAPDYADGEGEPLKDVI
jgi:hypothetical protein